LYVDIFEEISRSSVIKKAAKMKKGGSAGQATKHAGKILIGTEAVERFTVSISDEQLRDLKSRLSATRWPDSVQGGGWRYGADLDYMCELRDYWLEEFDWRREEARMNQFCHYKAQIDELNIHFIHERGEGKNSLPLLITHGWPGSFLEFLKMIPLLSTPSHFGRSPSDSFDVIVPSLIGFGFSSPSIRPGCNTIQIAKLWHGLMLKLGYARYVVQGGDIGAAVSTRLAMLYPDHVKAVHLNYIPGSYEPFVESDKTAAERNFADSISQWAKEHGAYSHVQSREPQTLGIALNDSPMGLAAWIVPKFREWSDCGGDVERKFTKDELLSHVSLYWFTQTAASSFRMYFENSLAPLRLKQNERVLPPCGIARFPKEIAFPPREWVERGYNVIRWTEMPRGGHFAAAEEPELLAEDLRALFRPFRQ
jgi:pimeloyl-ACP methyl ester carboxylesterase